MNGKPRVGVFAAGKNGANLVRGLRGICSVAFVVFNRQRNTTDEAASFVRETCATEGYPLIEGPSVDEDLVDDPDLIFVAGWQFLFSRYDRRFVVFHDSLLPAYRGFAPTVTALIQGEARIGATAFAMDERTDAGDVYAQSEVRISYPITIRQAYEKLATAYGECAKAVIDRYKRNDLNGTPQDESAATYSIWRDAQDLTIDWTAPADRVARFVDAVGSPFSGARATYRGREIVVRKIAPAGEVRFVERHPGKIWSIDDNQPRVVCGSGTVRLLEAHYADTGEAVEFRFVRERLTS